MFDTAKWELSKEEISKLPKDILHDRVEACKIMLPKPTAEVEAIRLKNCRYMSQLYENGN